MNEYRYLRLSRPNPSSGTSLGKQNENRAHADLRPMLGPDDHPLLRGCLSSQPHCPNFSFSRQDRYNPATGECIFPPPPYDASKLHPSVAFAAAAAAETAAMIAQQANCNAQAVVSTSADTDMSTTALRSADTDMSTTALRAAVRIDKNAQMNGQQESTSMKRKVHRTNRNNNKARTRKDRADRTQSLISKSTPILPALRRPPPAHTSVINTTTNSTLVLQELAFGHVVGGESLRAATQRGLLEYQPDTDFLSSALRGKRLHTAFLSAGHHHQPASSLLNVNVTSAVKKQLLTTKKSRLPTKKSRLQRKQRLTPLNAYKSQMTAEHEVLRGL